MYFAQTLPTRDVFDAVPMTAAPSGPVAQPRPSETPSIIEAIGEAIYKIILALKGKTPPPPAPPAEKAPPRPQPKAGAGKLYWYIGAGVILILTAAVVFWVVRNRKKRGRA